MRVGLLATDSKYPNIPLMKISTYYKSKNNSVNWYNPFFSYDILYESKIYTYTPNYLYYPKCKIIRGGTGIDLSTILPDNIESIINVDYTLYPEYKYSLQLFSRGCPNKCPFCVVPKKEGNIYPVNPLILNPKGEYIIVLDNNFFANPEWKSSILNLINCKQPVKFDGIDVRLLTEEHLYYLNKLKLKTQLHIAWDNPKEKINQHIQRVLNYNILKPYKFMCYVLIGYNSTPEEDMYRVNTLSTLKIDPFIMPYNKKNKYQKRFARYVNHKAIFKSTTWEKYK